MSAWPEVILETLRGVRDIWEGWLSRRKRQREAMESRRDRLARAIAAGDSGEVHRIISEGGE